MTLSQIVGILAFIVQIGNLLLPFVTSYSPEVAVIVGALLAAIQAFSARITGTPNPLGK